MARVLTAEQMREVDRLTIEAGVPGLVLMENAASRVVEALVDRFPNLGRERITVLCGKGNNGGDGLAVARQMLVRGLASRVEVILATGPDELSEDAHAQLTMLRLQGCEPVVWPEGRDALLRATVLVDALLGTGLDSAVRGTPKEIIQEAKKHLEGVTVVAVDMPSGLPSDSAETEGDVLDAHLTVTFTAPKPGQALPPNAQRCGELLVRSIGTPSEIIEQVQGDRVELIGPAELSVYGAPRAVEAHKGTYGHVAVIAGSASKPGAAALAATSALRAGAGLCTVITARGAVGAIVGATPELMTTPADELPDGSLGPDSYRDEWLERASVVALGPGLGTRSENQELIRRLVAETEQPLVVDADGLTALAAWDQKPWPRKTETLVLTPHPGEMARLMGLSTKDVQADRLGVAKELAAQQDAIVVLKGAGTVIATPDGRLFLNSTGSPAMATGGSGDVLTGLIAGLLAQYPEQPAERTVAAAVWLHGKAGEIAAAALGERSTLASDLIQAFGDAFEHLR